MRFFLSDVFWAVKLEVIVFFLLSRIFLNVYNKIVLILQSEKKQYIVFVSFTNCFCIFDIAFPSIPTSLRHFCSRILLGKKFSGNFAFLLPFCHRCIHLIEPRYNVCFSVCTSDIPVSHIRKFNMMKICFAFTTKSRFLFFVFF